MQVILENSFLSSFDPKTKQLPCTMYAVPFNPPGPSQLLCYDRKKKELCLHSRFLSAGHHPSEHSGDALPATLKSTPSPWPRRLYSSLAAQECSTVTCASVPWDRTTVMQESTPSARNFDFRWQESISFLLSSSFYLKLLQYACFLYPHSTFLQLSLREKGFRFLEGGRDNYIWIEKAS